MRNDRVLVGPVDSAVVVEVPAAPVFVGTGVLGVGRVVAAVEGARVVGHTVKIINSRQSFAVGAEIDILNVGRLN